MGKGRSKKERGKFLKNLKEKYDKVENKKLLQGEVLVVILLLIGGIIYLTREKVTKVKVIRIETVKQDNHIIVYGEVVPKNVLGLSKKVQMKIKRIYVQKGDYVKKGQLLVEYYGVTKDGYNPSQDSRIREALNQKIITQGSMKDELIAMENELRVLRAQQRDLYRRKRIMTELFHENRATTMEINSLKNAVAEKNLEYRKSFQSVKTRKQTILLNESIINEELKERGENTLAPEDGLIMDVVLKRGENTSPAESIIKFAPKGVGKEVNLYIGSELANNINIGDITTVKRRNTNQEKETEEKGVIKEIAELEDNLILDGEKFNGILGTATLPDEGSYKIGTRLSVKINHPNTRKVIGVSMFSIFNQNTKEHFGYVYTVKSVEGKNIAQKIKVELGEKRETYFEILNLPIGTEVIGNPFNIQEGERVEVIE